MKHSIFLPDKLEPILAAHLNLRAEQFPGTEPRISAVFADALFFYSWHLKQEARERVEAPNPANKESLRKFIEEVEAKGGRLGL